MIFARRCQKFYVIIARKYFPEFWGHVSPTPVSYAYGGLENSLKVLEFNSMATVLLLLLLMQY